MSLSVCPSSVPSTPRSATSSMEALLSIGFPTLDQEETESHRQPEPDKEANNHVNGQSHKPKLLWHVQNREGYSTQKLYHPYDVAFLWDNRTVVVEGFYPYSRIQVLDNDGRSIKYIAQGDIMPYGITIDAEGYMAVTDHKDRTVKFYTPDGKHGLSWQHNMFDWPDGIATTATGKYVITDWTRGTINIHDIDGAQIRQFSSVDPSGGAQFSCPAYVAIDKYHRLIITDTFDHSVKIFDQEGNFLKKIGTGTSAPLKDPRGVTIDKNNNIVVADWGQNAVSVYSTDGIFMKHHLTSDEIKYPWGVAMNETGQLLVSEQKLDSNPGLKMYQCES
jgi:hypothetical protein